MLVTFLISAFCELDFDLLYCEDDYKSVDLFLFCPLKNLVNFDLKLFHPYTNDFLLAFYASFLFSKLWFCYSSYISSVFFFFLVKLSGSSKSFNKIAKNKFKNIKFPTITIKTKNMAAPGPEFL